MSKVFLCIPPDYDHNFPPLGTPALSGFLKSKGIDCFQRDLNLEYRDFLIEHINAPLLNQEDKKELLKPALKNFFATQLCNRYYGKLLPNPSDQAFAYLPYDNNTNSSFYFTERLLSSENLWRYLEDKDENSFLQFYEKIGIIDFIKSKNIDLVGISIISPAQAIASLTLGFMIKERLPNIHVNVGGPWPTLYRKVFLERREFFKCFDTIIVFDGETPLYRLTQALSANGAIEILNVITKEGNDDFSLTRTEEDLDQLPSPDFDGLPLEKYEGSKEHDGLALTFETSRGCYWSKCAYCVDLPLPKPRYRFKSPSLVVRDMKYLKERYGVKMLMFGDPGLSPRQMLGIASEILKEKLDINWWTMARLDFGFNENIFKKAASAGLKQINFGFESACDRVCDFLHKGNRRALSSRVIQNAAKFGIGVGMQTILGLPSETWEEALDTVQFLVEHKKEITSDVAFNVYYVTPANYVFEDPKKYGLILKKDPGLEFQFFIPFENPKGLASKEAYLLQHLYASLIAGQGEQDELALADNRIDTAEGEEFEFSLINAAIKMRYR